MDLLESKVVLRHYQNRIEVLREQDLNPVTNPFVRRSMISFYQGEELRLLEAWSSGSLELGSYQVQAW